MICYSAPTGIKKEFPFLLRKPSRRLSGQGVPLLAGRAKPRASANFPLGNLTRVFEMKTEMQNWIPACAGMTIKN
jgi:hypothetical protein